MQKKEHKVHSEKITAVIMKLSFELITKSKKGATISLRERFGVERKVKQKRDLHVSTT